MSLRGRALVVLGITIVLLLLLLHVSLRTMLLESFLRAEEKAVIRGVGRALDTLANELENLNATAADWAVWDDTYRFVRDGNELYRQTNLIPSTFETLRIDALAIHDALGRPLYAEERDFADGAQKSLSPQMRDILGRYPFLLAPADGERESVSGLALLGEVAVLLSAHPILQSNFQGPAAGTLLMARRLDRLSSLTQLTMTFQPYVAGDGEAGEVRIERFGRDRVTGFVPVTGLDGLPVATLRVDVPREIYGQALQSLNYLRAGVLAACIVFIFTVWFIIDRMILRRLSNLSGSLRKIRSSDDLTRRVAVTGRDELSHLEREINGMIEALEASESQIRHQAYHDPLTDLPNRTLFYKNLETALERAREAGSMLAVIFLDLDRFKLINDMLGHSVGDRLLQMVAQRLREFVGAEEGVSRLGGDEFTVLLPAIDTPAEADALAQRILQAFKEPFRVDDRDLYVNTSMGISVFPYDGESVETLIRNADAALFHMKEKGRNHYWFYSSEISAMLSKRALIEADLRSAYERNDFLLFYQPQVDLASGKVVGAEALLRWRRPDGRIASPDEFVGVLEETGLIVPVDEWVMRTACLQNKAWQDAGCPPIPVSVNVSTLQFQRPTLIETVTRILEETELNPRHLKIEITESLAMLNVEEVIDKLLDLQAMGVSIHIDDFGTGYSSLSYLKKFPIDTLKIDRSFVREIAEKSDDADIVASIIAMAQKLRINVLAEGVETEEQALLLRDLGCCEMQGFLFARPMPPEAIPAFLRDYRTPAALLPRRRRLTGVSHAP